MAKRMSSPLLHVNPLQLDLTRAVPLDCATVNRCLPSHLRCVAEADIWTLVTKPTICHSFLWLSLLPTLGDLVYVLIEGKTQITVPSFLALRAFRGLIHPSKR